MVAIAWRVATDPYAFSYYGLGPLLVALGIDVVVARRRSIPYCTLATAFVFFAAPLFVPANLCAAARLAWCVVFAAAVIRPWPQRTAHAWNIKLGASQSALAR
jgi:hypothetical protein